LPELLELTLASTDITVDPGDAAEVEIRVLNKGFAPDSAALEVEFADPSWVAIPVAGIALDPGGSRAVSIVFKPPRSPQALAGAHPFTIIARSIETGATSLAQGRLHVKPYHTLGFSVSPLRAVVGAFHSTAHFEARIENSGNVPEMVDLDVSDPEKGCLAQVSQQRFDVAPGETVGVPVQAQPQRRPLIGAPTLYGLSARAEALSHAFPPENAHVQLEYRALCTPFVAFIVALAAVYGAYRLGDWMQAPRIQQVAATPSTVSPGDPVRITYAAAHANSIELRDDTDNKLTPVDSSLPYVLVYPSHSTHYTLIAKSGSGLSAQQGVDVTVARAAPPPAPIISQFTASPATLAYGQSTILSWKVQGADSLILAPLARQIDPDLPSLQVTPGTTTQYTLVAKGKGGAAYKTITVNVQPAAVPLAPQVAQFTASPSSVSAGDPVKLEWNVAGASTVTISGLGAVDVKGSRSVSPFRSTKYTLTAFGPAGAQATSSVKVEVSSAAPRIDLFEAQPNTVPAGGTSTLNWKVRGASSILIDGIGPVTAEGSRVVTPATTTTYTLIVSDRAGHSRQKSVTITVGATSE
jgi:hypothetical protein